MEERTLYYESPIGVMVIQHNNNTLLSLQFQDITLPLQEPDSSFELLIKQQLDHYFEGRLTTFELPLAPAGTQFQQKVWQQLLQIPYGQTCSYKNMAIQLENPLLIRAAATANGKNPILLLIPCHRVIGSKGDLVGYAGGLWRKQWLIDHENKFANGVQKLF